MKAWLGTFGDRDFAQQAPAQWLAWSLQQLPSRHHLALKES